MTVSPEQIQRLAQIRLSKSLFLTDFLYCPEAIILNQRNLPDQLDLVIIAGRALCMTVLEPLIASFESIQIVEGFIASDLASACIQHGLTTDTDRIWDQLSEDGRIRAGVTVALPWALDQPDPEKTNEAVSRWIRGYLPAEVVKPACFPLGLHLTWLQGAAPDPDCLDQTLFDQFRLPPLIVSDPPRYYPVLPPA